MASFLFMNGAWFSLGLRCFMGGVFVYNVYKGVIKFFICFHLQYLLIHQSLCIKSGWKFSGLKFLKDLYLTKFCFFAVSLLFIWIAIILWTSHTLVLKLHTDPVIDGLFVKMTSRRLGSEPFGKQVGDLLNQKCHKHSLDFSQFYLNHSLNHQSVEDCHTLW